MTNKEALKELAELTGTLAYKLSASLGRKFSDDFVIRCNKVRDNIGEPELVNNEEETDGEEAEGHPTENIHTQD